MINENSQIVVGIGTCRYTSNDCGSSWQKSYRELREKNSLIISGIAKKTDIPFFKEGIVWNQICILENGFGVAINKEIIHPTFSDQRSIANVYITSNSGESWENKSLILKPFIIGRIMVGSYWPVAEFQSLAVSNNNVMLTWEDSGMRQEPFSHLLYSKNCAKSWRYRRLGQVDSKMYQSNTNKVIVTNAGVLLETENFGEKWIKRSFEICWPENYEHLKLKFLRNVVFTSNNTGFALIVHWKGNMEHSEPDIGLLKTENGGDYWEHLAVFKSQIMGEEINKRNMLDLKILGGDSV